MSLRFARSALLAALAAGLLLAAPAAAKYDPKFRPYQNFMRDFMDWDLGDMNHSFNAAPDERYDFDEGKLKQSAEAGASFLKKHGATLEALLAGYREKVFAPLPTYPPGALAQVNFSTPVVHFRYSRELARGFLCVAAKLFQDGRGRDAWRVIHAAMRFGAALRAGDGDPAALIQVMVGNAILNIASGPFTWQVLGESGFSAGELRGIAAEIAATRAECVPFRKVFEGEYHLGRNTIRDHLFDPRAWAEGDGDRSIWEMLRQVLPDERTRAVEIVLKRYDEIYRRTFAAIDAHTEDPVAAGSELDTIAGEVDRRGSPSLSMILSPVEAVADILMAVVYPNCRRAFVKDRESMLRLEGLRIGCLALAAAREAGEGVVDRAFAAAGTLPADLYAATHPVRIAAREDRVSLYSVGENGVDDGGCRGDDLVLFEIRRGRSRARRPVDACRANLKTLEGAAELHRMEHPGEKTGALPADPVGALVAGNYLKVEPVCPEGGTYAFAGGAFRCTRHGGLSVRVKARLLSTEGRVMSAGTTEA